MNENILVSVVMSVYKEPLDWIRQSIDSILGQTFKDFEFIIICDNPKGNDCIALLEDYSNRDNRIKLIFNEENIGLTKSLNKGLAVSKGMYIARMDADDISMPERLQKQYEFMQHNLDVIVLGTNFNYIGDAPFYYKFLKNVEFTDKRIKAHLLYGNCIAHSSVFIRKSILDKFHINYDESYRSSQDYRLWEILSQYGKFENLKEKLLVYRLSATQITKNKPLSQRQQAYSIRIRLQKKWMEYNNIECTDAELEHNQLSVLEKIKKIPGLKRTYEYKMIAQFIYIEAAGNHHRNALYNLDILNFSFQNMLLYIIKLVNRQK